MKKYIFILLCILLTLPTFAKMLRFGIYSMQDFHYFRLVEFDKCIKDGQIPCRWASDAGLGYGEPLFNFYGQMPYVIGEGFHLTGLSLVDSLKLTFIFSLIGSAISMFVLSKKIWNDNFSALVSSILYIYAPYRAVDVWVRGALPEALSFVLFPLILLFFEKYLDRKKRRDLLAFSASFAVLILTHNLSVVLFAPILIIWIPYRLWITKKIKLTPYLLVGFFLSILLSAFYLLPVMFESKFVNLESTTIGYFDFRGHFVTIYQLLFSRFWGYGGSVFGPEDGLNLSIGLFQWLIPVLILVALFITKKISRYKDFIVLFLIGWICLLLTHNKSTPIWLTLPFMKYIQFPWRFLGVAVFAFSLSVGVFAKILENQKVAISLVLIVGVIAWSVGFFREDIWYNLGDKDLTSGQKWVEQTRASIGDFWPRGKDVPVSPSPEKTNQFELVERRSNQVTYEILGSDQNISLPVSDFPGWIREYADNGRTVVLKFKNTPVRTLGNMISLSALLIVMAVLLL